MKRFLLLSNVIFILVLAYLSFRLKYYQKAMAHIFGTPLSSSGDCLVSLEHFDFHFLKQSSTPEIILIGDSMIRRGKWPELIGRYSVLNRGIAGDNTGCMCKRLKFLKGLNAKIWFLQGGINGITSTGSNEIFANYQEMIQFVKSEKATPILILLLHVSPKASEKFPHLSDYQAVNAKVDEINKMLVDYALSEGLKYLDLNITFSKEGRLDDQFTDDGLHLNEAAYKIWGHKMQEVLTHFPQLSQVVKVEPNLSSQQAQQ